MLVLLGRLLQFSARKDSLGLLVTNPDKYFLPYMAWNIEGRLIHALFDSVLVSIMLLYYNGLLIEELAASAVLQLHWPIPYPRRVPLASGSSIQEALR
jgi:hypothetical protein